MIGTALVLIIYLLVALWGFRYKAADAPTEFFLNKDYTTILKGLSCVIIVFVHIPIEYSNKIQDLIGSFAYICVTLFFMFSAFGLQKSFKNKPNYKKNFWKNRVLVLLIPYAISCVFKALFGFPIHSGGTRFVLILVIFYAVTYLAHIIPKPVATSVVICICVVLYSLTSHIFNLNWGWEVEALGFAYGVILAETSDKLVQIFSKKYWINLCILTFSSLALGLAYLKFKSVAFAGDYLLKAVLGIILILWVLCFTFKFQPGNKANRLLGKLSYEVFLFHGFVVNLLMYLSLENHFIELNSGAFIVLTFAGTFVLAYVFNKIDVKISAVLKNTTIEFNRRKKG